MPLYVGLMSGTSLDGLDAVLARIDDTPAGLALTVHAHHHRAFDDDLRAELLALNRRGDDELHRAAVATRRLVALAADTVLQLLADAGVCAAEVRAIGSHGQTVRHRPPAAGVAVPYTIQLDDGAWLAEHTGIDVVCDFRRRDLAAGGQGAPLVPAFHAACFARPGQAVAVLNSGGIANLTLLGAGGEVAGFDCGPGNVLLDLWCERHTGRRYDEDGRWAAGGRVDDALLAALLAEPYFALPPPKTTGRDLFHAEWLDARLQPFKTLPAADVQATLVALTAAAASDALRRHAPATERLIVCGGGARNHALITALAARSPGVEVVTSAAVGLDPMHVEAAAFAWLAHAHLERQPGNRCEVTGARGPRVLGALYPAR
ncbi:anhydro-N-acetylmuramic acid kinase [Azohydromonas sediminis]|uniref:anhydro-N-acetylmuramic acid kinase n=1 Tax=Azohydromonas sediminis TaxID=2259674 RepID=UPI000E6500B1|nr:anhydro-N-acetylmuramic acid kinase [Azohydromonas sediminis]